MSTAVPLGRSAELHVLFNGYVGSHVASTISFVRDGDVHAIIDPGMAPSRAAILEPLAALGVAPEAITDAIAVGDTVAYRHFWECPKPCVLAKPALGWVSLRGR